MNINEKFGLSAGGAKGSYPFFFPTLFGTGQDGELTLTTDSDVGYLGSYGPKEATNATLAAGQTLTIAPGSSSGALMIACTGKLTIAGTIYGRGANGSNANHTTGSGAGGASAGGGVGGAAVTTHGNGAVGVAATKIGHGTAPGGTSGGGVVDTNVGNFSGGNMNAPLVSSTAVSNQRRVLQRLSSTKNIMFDPFSSVGFSAGGTASTTNSAAVNASTGNVWPWGQTASGLLIPLGFIPGAPGGFGGGAAVDGSSTNAVGGGGGGGGGTVIIEADTIELVSGYSIDLQGGDGGNAASAGGTSTALGGGPGWGGQVIMICRTLIGSTSGINCNAGTRGTGAGSGVATQVDGIAGGFTVIKV